VFTAYYDESGSPDAHSVVVAGFVASNDQWKEFERNWNGSLHQFGISHFHAVEFAQSVGEFAKWKGHEKNPDLQSERQWFLRQLLAHIKLRTRFCCSHVVRMVDYRKVNGVYILDAVQPYALCGRTAVASVSEWGSRNKIPEGQIRHIFEDGAKHKGFLLKRLIKDKGFEPIFKKKDEAVPLQAADLLAYETFVGIRSIFEKGVTDFDDLRYPLRMLDEVPHRLVDWGTYSENDLETFCLNARIPRRDSIDAKEFEGLTRKEIEAKLLQIWGVPSGRQEP
jgi:hypothetical protein